jgi:hypothetical protein
MANPTERFCQRSAPKGQLRKETTMKNETESIHNNGAMEKEACRVRRRAPFLTVAILGQAMFTSLAWSQTCNDGCNYSNTYQGNYALVSVTSGGNETAFGSYALTSTTSGSDNTAIGAYALVANTQGQQNTAVGSNALYSNTTSGNVSGDFNTAVGASALFYNTTGSFNTATGATALYYNTTGNYNTANGHAALFSNTTGYENTAIGSAALSSNTTGYENTAIGYLALHWNTTGSVNTAVGNWALGGNTTGAGNTATGNGALLSNTTGLNNTATGAQTLYNNSTGTGNTASGFWSLLDNSTGSSNSAYGEYALLNNTIASNNTAVGYNALGNNTTGASNIALGESAGINLTTGSNNIDIGNKGVAAEANTIRIGKKGTQTATFIAGIRGTTVAGGIAALIDANGRLGTTTSSARFKEAIQPMYHSSEAILSLQPVTFHYKKELDPDGIPQFGLVAEQVAKVNPDLVARDEEGQPYTVRYDAVNAMLLNEFLKQHRKLEERTSEIAQLKATIAQQQSARAEQKIINLNQQKEIDTLKSAVEAQAMSIRKVNDQLALQNSAPRLVSTQ